MWEGYFFFWSNFHLQAVIILVSATIDWLQRYKKHNQKLLKLHLKSYQKTQDFSLSFTMSWMFNDNRVITINSVLEFMKSHCLWCSCATAFSNHCKKLKVTSDLTPWDGRWKRWIFSVGMTIFFSSVSEDNRLGYFQNNPVKGWKCSLYQDTLDSYLNRSKEYFSCQHSAVEVKIIVTDFRFWWKESSGFKDNEILCFYHY